MHFNKAMITEHRGHKLFKFFLSFIFLLFALSSLLFAEIRDRVVAYVDNTAITLSELDRAYVDALRITRNITKEEVLNTLINRVLLLKEARKIRLEAPSEDELLKEYIDLKIKSFILVRDDELMNFYEKHLEDFQGKEFNEVREEIEHYLIEKEMNQRLKMYIDKLKENACISIQLNENFK